MTIEYNIDRGTDRDDCESRCGRGESWAGRPTVVTDAAVRLVGRVDLIRLEGHIDLIRDDELGEGGDHDGLKRDVCGRGRKEGERENALQGVREGF